MADIDDLLGGPSTTGAAAAAVDMDDLLGGGGGGPSSPAPPPDVSLFDDDDDLLFGGGGGAGSPASSASPTAPQRGGGGAASGPPAKRRSRNTSVARRDIARTVDIEKLDPKKVSAALQPYCETGYFCRFVALIDKEGQRSRRVVMLNDNCLYVVNSNVQVERTIHVTNVMGVVLQVLQVSKFLGAVKEHEQHVVVQVEGDKDLFFTLNKDDGNGPCNQLDFVPALSAVCAAYDMNLPVSTLQDNEDIFKMAKHSRGDDRLRKQLSEALAFRTELISELMQLTRTEAQLNVSISCLKNSPAAQASGDIEETIRQLQQSAARKQRDNQALEQRMKEEEQEREALTRELKDEEEKRSTAVRSTMERAEQEALMRQVTEFELVKAAHKREMDKIATLTAMYERCTQARQPSYTGVAVIPRRIAELEEEHDYVRQKLLERADGHSKVVKTLAEAKRRVGAGRQTLEATEARLHELQAIPLVQPAPAHLMQVEDAPILEPVSVVPTVVQHDAVAAAPPAAAPPAATSAPAINLDDDLDDDDDI